MRTRMIVAMLLSTAALGPAAAQDRGDVPAATESRFVGANSNYDTLWDAIGLLGLLGLIGLLPKHEEDSYHPSDID
jgi:hypothetical protein